MDALRLGRGQTQDQRPQAPNRLHRSFTWDASIRWVDDREDYGELRQVAIGFIGATPYAVTFTERDDDVIWIISIRKATKAESRKYEREI